MAAPFVAGVAALLLSYNPSLTPLELRQIILHSADNVTDSNGNSVFGDLCVSGGRLNAYKALTYASSNYFIGERYIRTLDSNSNFKYVQRYYDGEESYVVVDTSSACTALERQWIFDFAGTNAQGQAEYYIRSVYSPDKYLYNASGTIDLGFVTSSTLSRCKWTITTNANGYYYIKSSYDGNYLVNNNGSLITSGSTVTTTTTKWYFDAA